MKRHDMTAHEQPDVDERLHELYMLVGKLKKLARTGWLVHRVGGSYPESVADHMYRMGFMAMTLPLEQHEDSCALDRNKVIQMALVHDVSEALAGDLVVGREGMTTEKKHQLEVEAIAKIKTLLPSLEQGDSFESLWLQYENQTCSEAAFVKDLDKYDMILQALEYEVAENKPNCLQEFFDSTKDVFQFSCVKRLVALIYDKRRSFSNSFTATQVTN